MKHLRGWGLLTRLEIGKGFKHGIRYAKGIGEENKELVPGDSCFLGDLSYCNKDGRSRKGRLKSLSYRLYDLDIDLDVQAGIKGG